MNKKMLAKQKIFLISAFIATIGLMPVILPLKPSFGQTQSERSLDEAKGQLREAKRLNDLAFRQLETDRLTFLERICENFIRGVRYLDNLL